ncbi:hypothetical protein MIMGU_mgv1a022403mg [Erythranthe guttata]|uniref:Serine aminopeptidase S33 domain-containing protein n=1 Tax=Erythranthe guttata TaxID=4155 RepID=A0A022QTY4_ERYGU|nr:hypothetical protein MIMGU_mgv1a022403mg [Erythranthe guttata]
MFNNNIYGMKSVTISMPLKSTAARVVNGLPATGFRQVLRRTNRKLSSCWTTTRSSSGGALRSKDYYSEPKFADDDGEPPRWFSPVECGCRSTGSPLLLFLPVGHGLMLQHKRLVEIFVIWCLHIPVTDRTSLPDLVKLVERTVRSEHGREANKRPIYLVGESFGASLALVVAAHNPHIDLILILANPAASLSKSLLQSAVPFSDMIHKHLKAGQFDQVPVETVLWKLGMIYEMQSYLDSHLHAVEAQTLILNSGNDMLLPNNTESERLSGVLKRCEVRSCSGNGNPLFLDETFDLVATIKRVSYYRRGASVDYMSDFFPPTPSELNMILEPFRWMATAVDPVMISTRVSGELVRGLGGIPSKGPVLLVGNHMMMGMDAVLLVSNFWTNENIMVRGMAHPLFFERLKKGGKLPELSVFDFIRVLGGVSVSATNLYKGLSTKSHVLLFPGGAREVFHHKGEEHKMFWPAEPEFVRMAAKFGAKIIPFGSVGEDDVVQLLLDSNDQMKIPHLKALIEELTGEAVRLSDAGGEIGKQLLYFPVVLPKLPGRFYFRFGKPISVEGREDVLRNKEKANEMYLEIQNEVQKCIDYLKEKGEKDPYRNLLARLAYQGFNGFDSQVPTFDI